MSIVITSLSGKLDDLVCMGLHMHPYLSASCPYLACPHRLAARRRSSGSTQGWVVAASPTGTTAISPISRMPIFHPPITPQSTQPLPSLTSTHRAFGLLESSTIRSNTWISLPPKHRKMHRDRVASARRIVHALVSRAWNEARREAGVWMSCSSGGSVRTCRFGGRIDSHESRGGKRKRGCRRARWEAS